MLGLLTCCIAIIVVALVAVVHGLKIPVLYESKHTMLIIDEPYGISHHNDSRDQSHSILQLIRQQRHALDNKEGLRGVHRMDKVTSGILVLANQRSSYGNNAIQVLCPRKNKEDLHWDVVQEAQKEKTRVGQRRNGTV
jgi:23S rRNA-/tRNA-specific pseudouridylate synthase